MKIFELYPRDMQSLKCWKETKLIQVTYSTYYCFATPIKFRKYARMNLQKSWKPFCNSMSFQIWLLFCIASALEKTSGCEWLWRWFNDSRIPGLLVFHCKERLHACMHAWLWYFLAVYRFKSVPDCSRYSVVQHRFESVSVTMEKAPGGILIQNSLPASTYENRYSNKEGQCWKCFYW